MEKVFLTKQGSLSVSNEAITTMISLAATEVEGVVLVKHDIAGQIMNFLKGLPQSGISLEEHLEGLSLSLSLVIKKGYKLTDLALQVQENVKNALETMLHISVSQINLRIVGIEE